MSNPLIEIYGVTKSFDSDVAPAVKAFSAVIKPGEVTGVVGPDGAGKTTLLRLMAGLLVPDEGYLEVCGTDTRMASDVIRNDIAYMPQRFGLYEDLSVTENLELYADLRDVSGSARQRRFETLLSFTGLAPFANRLAGKLSGGMKQKLGLACALMATPKILLLDEPSVGVDPISRKELWHMTYQLAEQGIGVVWSSAYLDEAAQCKTVFLMSAGELLYYGAPKGLTDTVTGRTFTVKNVDFKRRAVLAGMLEHPDVIDGTIHGRDIRFLLAEGLGHVPDHHALKLAGEAVIEPTEPTFEDAFIALLGGSTVGGSPFAKMEVRGLGDREIAIDTKDLTRKFGDFTATDKVTFNVHRGHIFGLIGPNGAGKSTTFKMLCGLLKPTSGTATVAGLDLRKAPSAVRARIGYMAQNFSLYGDLSVRQNLLFFAGVYGLTGKAGRRAADRMSGIFGFGPYLGGRASDLSLGYQRRLALACAAMHEPEILFLDEPTSGVDPRTRREFWGHINAMVTRGVTIIVTTHFMEEAEYCDQIALINHGKIIAAGEPDTLKKSVRLDNLANPTLEDAFIAIVEKEAAGATG